MVNMHVKEHGMPSVGRGEYDMVACVHWYIDYLKGQIERARKGDETEQQARARLVKAMANLRELEYAREQGELIHVSVVRFLWERLVVAFKNKILSLPSKLPQRIIGCRNLGELKAILEQEVYEALNELSITEIDLPPFSNLTGIDPADDPAHSSTSQADRQRVGGPGAGVEPRVKRRAGKVADRAGRVPEGDHGRGH
jgi:phage terminase Nu1 subunit (DNA packaging protein)